MNLNKMNRNNGKWFLTALLVITASALFVALGFWQLDRAAQVKELQKPFVEQPIVLLSEVAEPNTNLSGESINRIVQFSGSYVAQFEAPNQVDAKKDVGTWLVGLMEVDGGGNILVVRGATDQEMANLEMIRGDLVVTGRLFHRQYEDVTTREPGQLSRIDPALVLADYSGDYYDGFVLAQREERDGVEIEVDRVELSPAEPTVPGYYWQHIAYVVIWWLMALVVLFLPVYSRWRERAAIRNEQGGGEPA